MSLKLNWHIFVYFCQKSYCPFRAFIVDLIIKKTFSPPPASLSCFLLVVHCSAFCLDPYHSTCSVGFLQFGLVLALTVFSFPNVFPFSFLAHQSEQALFQDIGHFFLSFKVTANHEISAQATLRIFAESSSEVIHTTHTFLLQIRKLTVFTL